MMAFPLLTCCEVSGSLPLEPRNSSTKVCQYLEHGSFFGVRTRKKYGVFSVISGRESANRIPCKGEYAGRSSTVSSSRPFLRSAKANIEKSTRFPMFRFFLSSRWTRFQYRFLSLSSFLICRAVALVLLAAVLLFGCAGELVGGGV